MTAHAGQWGVLIGWREVTGLAWNGCVQADEGKLGKVVVKKHLFSPTQVVVAPLTPFAFLALVNIILVVTSMAALP